jgi:protein SCO1/2
VTTATPGPGTQPGRRSTYKYMAGHGWSRVRRGVRGVVPSTVALLAVCAMGLLVACGSDDAAGPSSSTTAADDGQFAGYTREPVPSVRDVSLPAADGTPVAMPASQPGGLRIVYFGYTSCPDVCPTTMSDLKRALATLPEDQRAKVQVDMVTIDPARDTAEKLPEYVTTFITDGTALRTDDQAALRAAADAFGADYSVEPGPDGEPEVKHTAELYAVDDAGNIVMIWPFGTTSKDIGEDLARLLDGDRPTTTTLPEGDNQ